MGARAASLSRPEASPRARAAPHLRRAEAAFAAQSLPEALAETRAALAHDPAQAAAHAMFGRIALALGQGELALAPLHKALTLDPDCTPASHALGRLLQDRDGVEAGLPWLERAARQDAPSRHHADLSCAYAGLGRFADAIAAAEAAVRADPECAIAWTNRAYALAQLGRTSEALAAYDEALALQPEHAIAQYGRACVLLRAGDYERGWPAYEWRWRGRQEPRRDIAAPPWAGETLAGRTILLHGEQGLGDVVMFARFAPQLARRGARVIVQAYPHLLRLLGTLEGVAALLPPGTALPPVDCHAPLGSLPHLLGVRLESLSGAPYLSVPDEAARAWQTLRPAGWRRDGGLVVGLAWAGAARDHRGAASPFDARRSIPPGLLAPLLGTPGVRFVCLQAGEARDAARRAGLPLLDVMEGVRDFADTAARLADIDLLITVDTAIAHVAGALGRPVWLLSRFDGCWRWLEGREDSPWYSSARLFRQPAPGDWKSVIDTVAGELAGAIGTAAGG